MIFSHIKWKCFFIGHLGLIEVCEKCATSFSIRACSRWFAVLVNQQPLYCKENGPVFVLFLLHGLGCSWTAGKVLPGLPCSSLSLLVPSLPRWQQIPLIGKPQAPLAHCNIMDLGQTFTPLGCSFLVAKITSLFWPKTPPGGDSACLWS